MNTGAIVLCGGQSSRMGHDKATLPFGSERMLQRIVRQLCEMVDPERIIVVGAIGQVLPELPGTVQRATDRRPGRGPLEGLAVGLQSLPAEIDAAFVTSCDNPFLIPAFIERLLTHLPSCDVVVPRDGDRIHPLAAVYRSSVATTAQRLIDAGERRLQELFNHVRRQEISAESLREIDPDLLSLTNINRPDEYRRALVMAGIAS